MTNERRLGPKGPAVLLTMTPQLNLYDWIVVNSSGGKDSQAALDVVVQVANRQNVPRDRIIVAHANLGEVEWPGVPELVQEHARHYDLKYVEESRPQGDLLVHVEQRRRWPSSKQRYCTSDHKRGQIARVFTYLTNQTRQRFKHPPVRILNVFGFRAEESPARAKKKAFAIDTRLTNQRRWVEIWLPIHTWTGQQVWDRIAQAGTRPHWAYARGMTRLSCRFCIFAPRSQLILSARQPENQQLLEKYVQLEIKIGHRFTHKLSIQEVQAAAAAGEQPAADDGKWNM